MTEVSVILPAYNEAKRIRETVAITARTLQEITPSFEIIIAEDGSTDGTDSIAAELAGTHEYVKHLHSDARQGRGRALNRAFKFASGDILCYIDVDLATDMKHLRELIDAIRYEGYDFSTGSRMMPTSDVKRPLKRGIASKGFNFLTRNFLRSGLYDHQCGFKGFKRESLFELMDSVEDEHWFWDTEILVRAQHAGYKVKEFPVIWRHGGATKVDLVKDVIGMGSQILRLWWQLHVLPALGRRKKTIITSVLAIILLALISTVLGAQDIIESAKTASIGTLIFAAFVYLFSWPFRGARYQQILSRLGYPQPLGFLTGTIFISQSANVVLPARIGDITRAYILKQGRNMPLTTGFSSVTVERVFDIVAITSIGAFSASIAATDIQLDSWVTSMIYLSTGIIVLFFAVLFGLSLSRDGSKRIRSIVYRFSRSGDYTDKVADIASQFVHEIGIVSVKPGSFAVVLVTSLLVWFVDIATCYTVLSAFPAVDISSGSMLALVFLAIAIGNIAKMFPITPGAIGTYEATLTTVFALGGIEPVIGFTAAVIDHIIKNSVTLVGGGLALSSFGMKWGDVLTIEKPNPIVTQEEY
ncbi:MAG: flippase-like domain-containing protein [Methanosarcinaceae archaeon]|nr:flippase-like domain-containing protein [Methanosarcinaceae archaeon]